MSLVSEDCWFAVQRSCRIRGKSKSYLKDVRDRGAIMVCKVKFGAKILHAYSPLDIKVKQQLSIGRKCKLVCN